MSLANCKPVTFIGTRDRATSRQFYTQVLGLPEVAADDHAVVYDLAGTMLRLTDIGPSLQPQPHTVLGWLVEDIAATMEQWRARGVEFQFYDGFGMGEDCVWQAPGGGAKIAWFLDPAGNNLSLTQF